MKDIFIINKAVKIYGGDYTDIPIAKRLTEKSAKALVKKLRKKSNSQLYSYCKI